MMQSFSGSRTDWNDLISRLPSPHLLQTWEWSQVKAKYGWQPMPFVWQAQPGGNAAPESPGSGKPIAAAMVLKRRIPTSGFAARLNILYIPKGPLCDWSDELLRVRILDDLQAFVRSQSAIFLKIDPDVVLGTGIPGEEDEVPDPDGQAVMSDLKRRGWRFSADQIQFRNTVLIDLSLPEEKLLAGMKQKTRYNVRLASRKGVTVRAGDRIDLPMLYRMYTETSLRDGFAIRQEGYYLTVWESFMQGTRTGGPIAEPLIAEVDGDPVAAVFVFSFAGSATYLYGMSREAHREKMPNYLLQWEAIRRARAAGCHTYDLWGAPDVFNESDGMWGVFRFKEGLGGQVVRTLGAWDFVPKPFWYRMYSEFIPRVLSVMRLRGRAKTRQNLG